MLITLFVYFQLPLQNKRKRRQYDPALIAAAYTDVRANGMSVYKAARLHGIPESTLRDRHLGIQPCDTTDPSDIPIPGRGPTLSRCEEGQLVDHVTYMANVGYGYSRQAFLRLASDYATSLGKKAANDPSFGQSWYTRFSKRWPTIHLAKPEKLSIVRAKATSEEVLRKYYTELDKVLTENGLKQKPERIWNVDETGMSMEHSPQKVICSKGTIPPGVTSARGKNITIISGGNAAGNHLPPYYIFPGKRWNSELLEDTCPGANGEMTESGWSNTDSFLHFLDRHFTRFVPRVEGRTDLIIVDGHTSHVNLTMSEWGRKNGVIFFVLPPHSSHLTQPLDVGCFAPLKAIYNAECQRFMRENPGQQITRYRVGKLSSVAYLKALSPENLVSSFRKTGIHPLENTIDPVKVMPATVYAVAQENDDQEGTSEFLNSRKIVRISTPAKTRTVRPTIIGNITSDECRDRLHDNPTSTTSAAKTSSKKRAISPQPGPSRYEDEEQIAVDDETCCVCRKSFPDNSEYDLEFTSWGQCDACSHWTHLKYCSPIRVLRRSDTFLCPHCQ
ncbi:MAG: helix-turn-helix domain-containing protein [Sedimenticola sp.]